MVRYLQPDTPALAYFTQGDLLSLSSGDFFKCAHCRRFQRFEGRLYLLGQLADSVTLCCEPCRLAGAACFPWPSGQRLFG